MIREIRSAGQYILFDTAQRYHMIALDDRDYYVWRGPNRLELSDMGHEAAVILHEGEYFLFTPESSEDRPDMLHLACQDGDLYRIYRLPQGLPTEVNSLVDIEEVSTLLSRDALLV